MFDNLQIAIPSRSRPHAQRTIHNLSDELWSKITLVVPADQYQQYRTAVPLDIDIVPFGGSGIGNKREFILKMHSTGKLIMMDDDLTFYKRVSDAKFERMSKADSIPMVTDIVDFLDRYVMVGMVDKFMSQTRPRGHVECSRFNKVLAFNRDTLPQPWPSFRLPHDEEHDVHLQLLVRGYKTAVLTEYSKSDPVQAPGGCTDWRCQEIFDQTYELLLGYWPTIVTVYGKTKVRYNWAEAKRIGGII